MKTLTIRQPYAFLIVNGYKTVENRTWRTAYPWVLETHRYENVEGLLASLETSLVGAAEAKAKELIAEWRARPSRRRGSRPWTCALTRATS